MVIRKQPSAAGNSVHIPTAVYRRSEIPEFRRNPLIEALPPIFNESAWMDSLEVLPQFDPAERKLADHLRPYSIMRLHRSYILLPHGLDLASRAGQVLRGGYVGRNPCDRGRILTLEKAYAEGQAGGGPSPRFVEHQPISSLSVMGFSGVGKSTTIERILGAFPQVLYHPDLGLHQIPWMKLDCPPDGSTRQLGVAGIAEFDRILGTDFSRQLSPRTNAEDLLDHFKQLATVYSLGLLVVDEIQNLSIRRSGGREAMLNFFQRLCNTLGVPVLLVGTMKARNVLSLDFRHARRNAAMGSFAWEPLRRGEAWDYLVESFFRYQWVRIPVPFSKSLSHFLHDQTQGVIAIFSAAYMIAQMRAIRTKTETLTEKLFAHVLEKDFAPVQPMLKALRSGNPHRIKHYEDIWPLNLEAMLEEEQRKTAMGAVRTRKGKQPAGTPLEAQAAVTLESMGYESAVAEEVVRSVAGSGTFKTAARLVRKALELLDPVDEVTERLAGPDPQDLRQQNAASRRAKTGPAGSGEENP